jgi:hypothetical protein
MPTLSFCDLRLAIDVSDKELNRQLNDRQKAERDAKTALFTAATMQFATNVSGATVAAARLTGC